MGYAAARLRLRLRLRARAVAVAAALLLAMTGCAGGPEALFRQAQQALAADDPETAARLFKEITIAEPDAPLAASAHYELAQMYYLRLRDVGAARDSLLKILTDYPDAGLVRSARRLLARLYERELASPIKALAQYAILREEGLEDETEREVLLAVADCHYRLDALEASAEAYREALRLPYHPAADPAYLRLATIEWLLGSPDESLRLLRELQAMTGNDDRAFEAAVAEIELLAHLDRYEEANGRLRDARERFRGRAELGPLQRRVQAAYRQAQSLDSDGPALEELQKTIRWGSGRRRAAASRDPS